MIKRIHINVGLISAVALIAGDLFVSGAFPEAPEKALSDAALAFRKNEAARMVHVVAVGLGGQCAGTADVAKRIALIRAFINPIRFYKIRRTKNEETEYGGSICDFRVADCIRTDRRGGDKFAVN